MNNLDQDIDLGGGRNSIYEFIYSSNFEKVSSVKSLKLNSEIILDLIIIELNLFSSLLLNFTNFFLCSNKLLEEILLI